MNSAHTKTMSSPTFDDVRKCDNKDLSLNLREELSNLKKTLADLAKVIEVITGELNLAASGKNTHETSQSTRRRKARSDRNKYFETNNGLTRPGLLASFEVE